jgi:hypothetical protein
MSDPIRNAAVISVARGCGFGGLAIVTAMIGLSFDPELALKLGGYSWLLTAIILLLHAFRAPHTPYARTEVWLMLPASDRPPAMVAQRIVATTRRDVLLRFAFWLSWVSVAHMAAALLLSLILG